eukprot:190378_1
MITKSQRYTQHGSFLYFYTYYYANKDNPADILMQIDLNKVKDGVRDSIQTHISPKVSSLAANNFNSIENKCMVANNDYVYIISESNVLIFTIDTQEWSNVP